MRKNWIGLLCALLCLSLTAGMALADVDFSYEGEVVAGDALPVPVAFGGRLESVNVQTGSWVNEGDVIGEIGTTPNYAPVEGTVAGLFAVPGDATESVTERYGAVLYIEPTHRYIINGTDEKAYNDSENHYLHQGEKVYLSCLSDGSHTGTGMITVFPESGYTIEVTGGNFYLGEKVDIFRQEDRDAKSRIGRGTVARAKPVAVKGSGSVLKLHVENGDFVERGELLFETVEGGLDGLYAPDSRVIAPASGVVASAEKHAGDTIAKGDALIKINPANSFLVQFTIPESELFSLREGQPVTMALYWDDDSGKTYDGVIQHISYIKEEQKTDTDRKAYRAYATFEADERIRLGMTMIVYPAQTPAEPEAETETAETEEESGK